MFGLLGSTTVPIMAFGLPVIFLWKLSPKKKYRRKKIWGAIMAVSMLIITAVSGVYNVYALIAKETNSGCESAQTIE